MGESSTSQNKTVKLADVARAAGVSQGTVSNVFNRPSLVSEQLRERVEEAARSLGYRGPDPRGRLLRAGRVNAIGVVAIGPLNCFFDDQYTRLFLSGVARACEARGAGISLVSATDDEIAAWNIRTALVDGFILHCLNEGNTLVELAKKRGLPFVAVDFPVGPGLDVVKIDDYRGAREAAQHLVDLGHRHFAVFTFETEKEVRVGFVDDLRAERSTFEVVRRRLSGYRDVFHAAGLPPQPVFETGSEYDGVCTGVDAVLAAHPETTAFVCTSDRVALHVITYLQSLGRKVPDDFSVIGFDGIEEASSFVPPLTTIRQPAIGKGEAAVEMILGDKADGIGDRVIELPVELVIAGSTAQPRKR
ncbi:LacI family DNA-binding transcriptional regulator [Pleomorphomonas oryzae]|uniref:LacI family DNA-binding transcriptional regulator n=1 Tax=Pleomorphomonas oryzae TaxID=261934 RepID=UPI00047E2E55|nr:LacI family DNA-binding transcriptional regulator [Pleomorphomonas oryzae]